MSKTGINTVYIRRRTGIGIWLLQCFKVSNKPGLPGTADLLVVLIAKPININKNRKKAQILRRNAFMILFLTANLKVSAIRK